MASDTGGTQQSEQAAGMPQLDPSSFDNQIFWLVVALAAIFWMLSRLALPRIAQILERRRQAVDDDLAMAEKLRRKAEDIDKVYEQTIAEARSEGQAVLAQARAVTRDEIEAMTDKTMGEIDARVREAQATIKGQVDAAMASVHAQCCDLAGEILCQLGFQADDTRIAAAVEAQLATEPKANSR